MFSFATILLRKSSNLAQALTTIMSTKKQQSVNRPNLKSELGLEDLLSWWRSPLLDCLNGIVGHLVPFIDFLVIHSCHNIHIILIVSIVLLITSYLLWVTLSMLYSWQNIYDKLEYLNGIVGHLVTFTKIKDCMRVDICCHL